MEPVWIEYEITENDYIDFMAYDLKKKQSGRLLPGSIIFAALMGLISIAAGEGAYSVWYIAYSCIVTVITGALFFGAMVLSRRWQVSYNVKSTLHRGQVDLQYIGPHRLELRENDIEVRYGTACEQKAYAVIHKVEDYESGIVIRYNQISVDFIPSSAFGTLGSERIS